MKKEGIQTRNRKLSSKSKKKKGMGGGCLPMGGHLGVGMSDLMKPLDPSKTFGGGFSSMGKHLMITLKSTEFELKIIYFCKFFRPTWSFIWWPPSSSYA